MHSSGEKQRIDYPILAITLLSVLYNCILAYINHNIMHLTVTPVVLCESTAMLLSVAYILKKGIYEEDLPLFLYLLFTLIMTIYVTVLNHITFIDQFRNVLIVFCFAGIGGWANERTMRLAFFIGCLCVFAGLVCEVVSTPFYVSLFGPGEYFENTRGIKQASFNNTGLFANALGFEGRFSFGLINHRSSSIFLEQVSLANFCGVIVIYLLSFWPKLGFIEKALCIATIVLILLTNDTRTMLIFSFISIFGYFLFPKIPKAFDLVLMPMLILVGFFVHYMKPNETGDNFTGRIGLTITKMLDLDVNAVLGLEVSRITEFADSGYVYLIYGSTIFGLIMFWLFICLFPAGESPAQRRCAHSLSLFIFLNMMIGGTAIFSMKIAGLLWLLVGYMRFSENPRSTQEHLEDVASSKVPG
ncbi:hypothetical protein DTW90_06965 [Neorhizobium sp. P12A]|jgi:hypothetical protein|uniref:hypothetical protein n=1 Tax=Rhizobium/Agrobacterium group TaxID=227290 RepID=UPI00104ACA56|nr:MULTISPECIES: hypothetical protein [Rhizobium/Agrobacterium group]KAA0699168.1 hypothetical protein DTW90_06965 [Neorhizobium sp. P12A]TCR90696.1 hypothetical protein EV561_10385 [Rhizobium sp. BK376]